MTESIIQKKKDGKKTKVAMSAGFSLVMVTMTIVMIIRGKMTKTMLTIIVMALGRVCKKSKPERREQNRLVSSV